MKQKILEALKAKFVGVNANVLNRIADKLAKTVTTDEEVATAVAGVTQDFIEIIESYGDSRATEAQQTAVANYEGKYGLKEGKPIGGAGAGKTADNAKPKAENADTVPAWAQAIIDSNKSLTERLNRMDGERTTATRKQQLATIVEKLPKSLRKPYERISVETLSDDDFNALVGDVTKEVDGLVSDIKARGAVFGRPAAHNGGNNQGDALTKEQEAAISARQGDASKNGQPF